MTTTLHYLHESETYDVCKSVRPHCTAQIVPQSGFKPALLLLSHSITIVDLDVPARLSLSPGPAGTHLLLEPYRPGSCLSFPSLESLSLGTPQGCRPPSRLQTHCDTRGMENMWDLTVTQPTVVWTLTHLPKRKAVV